MAEEVQAIARTRHGGHDAGSHGVVYPQKGKAKDVTSKNKGKDVTEKGKQRDNKKRNGRPRKQEEKQ